MGCGGVSWSSLNVCLLLIFFGGCCSSFLEVVSVPPFFFPDNLLASFVALATSASKLNSFFDLSFSMLMDICLMTLFGSKAAIFHSFQLLGSGLYPTTQSMGM